MKIMIVVSKTQIALKKNNFINLDNAFLELKKTFQAYYEPENRLKKIVVKTEQGTFNIFKSGAIIINSRILNSKQINHDLQEITELLKQFQQK